MDQQFGCSAFHKYCAASEVPSQTSIGLLIAFAVGAYGFYFRSHGLSGAFWLFGDQIRDWNIVMGGIEHLPLAGTPKVGGGYSWGPIYYWILWLVKLIIGPFAHYLPHAGGLGLSLLRSVAEVLLCMALYRQGVSLILVTAAGFYQAGIPFEASLAGIIWNPGVAVTLIMFSLAALFWRSGPISILRFITATILSWLAVQAHTPTIFVSAGILIALGLGAIKDKCPTRLIIMGISILVLQIPYFIFILKSTGTTQTEISRTFTTIMAAPFKVFSSRGYFFVAKGMTQFLPLLSSPIIISSLATVSTVFIVMEYGIINPYLYITALPLISACICYTFVEGLDTYWLLSLLPPFIVLLTLSFHAVTRRLSPLACQIVTLATLAIIIYAQPTQIALREREHMYPDYARLVDEASAMHIDGFKFSFIDDEYSKKRACLTHWMERSICLWP